MHKVFSHFTKLSLGHPAKCPCTVVLVGAFLFYFTLLLRWWGGELPSSPLTIAISTRCVLIIFGTHQYSVPPFPPTSLKLTHSRSPSHRLLSLSRTHTLSAAAHSTPQSPTPLSTRITWSEGNWWVVLGEQKPTTVYRLVGRMRGKWRWTKNWVSWWENCGKEGGDGAPCENSSDQKAGKLLNMPPSSPQTRDEGILIFNNAQRALSIPTLYFFIFIYVLEFFFFSRFCTLTQTHALTCLDYARFHPPPQMGGKFGVEIVRVD